MLNVSFSSNIEQVAKQVDNIKKRQIPFAAKNAVNETAYHLARKHLPNYTNKIFDGGATAWTRRGSRYIKASSKHHPTALVYYSGDHHPYIHTMVHGGIRTPEKTYVAVPLDLPRNKFGNVTRAGWKKIVNKKGGKYFVKEHKKKGEPVMFERMARGRLKLRLVYNRFTHYPRKYYDFYEESLRYVHHPRNGFAKRFGRHFSKAIASSNLRGR